MGKQAKIRRDRRRARESAGGREVDGADAPWWYSPWRAGLAGAAIMTVIAVVRLLVSGGEEHDDAGARAIDAAAAAVSSQLAEHEPNDTIASAQTVGLTPMTVRGTLEARGRDIYALDLDDGLHVLDADLGGVDGARLRISRDGDKDKLGVSAPTPIRSLGLASGRVYVIVDSVAPIAQDAEPGAAGSGEYTLSIRARRWYSGQEFEPNDTAGDPDRMLRVEGEGDKRRDSAWATTINRYQVRGGWSSPADIDCYELPLSVPPTGAVLRIEIEPLAAAVAKLWVLDDTAKLATRSAAATGDRLVIPALGARSWVSAYILCTSATAITNADLGSYQLRVETLGPPTAFEFEPNDDAKSSSALPRKVTIGGYLTAGDEDWFRISAGPASRVRATFGGVDGVAAELSFVDGEQMPLATKRGKPGAPIEVIAERPVSIRLRALEGTNVESRYQLTVAKQAEARAP